MKCDEEGCYEMAMVSIRKDLFGKSDGMRNLCSKHAPTWSFFGSVAKERDAAADRIRTLEADLHNATLAATQNKELGDHHFQRCRALEAALRQYGRHTALCENMNSGCDPSVRVCRCGYSELETKGDASGN